MKLQAVERDPAWTARTRGHRAAASRLWIWYLGVGAASATVFVLVDRPGIQAAVQVPVYAASAGLLVWKWWLGRATRPDPIVSLAVGAFALYFTASILGALGPLLARSEEDIPVPSPLDGMFLLSYVLLGLFLWRLGSRSGAVGRRDILDTLIVVGGMAPLFWVFLIAPLLGNGTRLAALITAVAYPVSVFALFALTVRLAFVARRRTVPHMLLAGWIIGELTADFVFLHAVVDASYAYGQAWQALWIASASCIGALALYPGAGVLLERHTLPPVDGSRRLWVLAGCLATPIVTLIYGELISDQDLLVIFPAVACFFLVFLLCLRLSGLMVDNAHQLRVQEAMRRLSEDLAHQAQHDPLTGLGNRLMFAEHADRALGEREPGTGRAPAVLLLDLDDFKMVNDTFGHDAGDRVLIEVARRLSEVGREEERVFRLGGDEFAFLLPQARVEDALGLADRICDRLSEPFDLGPRRVRPVACIGISIALTGQTRSALLAEADLAMYAAKTGDPRVPSLFDPAQHLERLDRHQLERDLRDALDRQEFRVLYQPLVHLSTSAIAGVEALLRWDHPTRGTIGPAEFIPIAEANGAILELGDWVLQKSLRQLLAWDEADPRRRLHVSVNVSPRQLADPDFVARTADLLRRSGLDPSRVTLEITEASFGTDAESLIQRLHELKRLGVALALDDFGTEYSSLSKLRQIPVDILKIDKAFIDGIATDPAELALTAAIVALAASLGKGTVAEGIETPGQLAELRRLGVEQGQGYLFARPLAAETITGLLAVAPGRAFQRT